MKNVLARFSVAILGLLFFAQTSYGAGSSFIFEGGLMDESNPANGVYDMTFTLFDLDVDGTSVGVYTNENVEVVDGLYDVQLPFTPSELNFTNRWIEIAAKANGELGDRTVLSPRSMLDTVPYASKASQADGVTPVSISTESLQFGAVTAGKLGSGSVTLEKINTIGAADGQAMVLRGSEMAWESLAYWSLLGNYGTIPGINFIGTLDDQTLEFRVNNQTALRLIPNEYAPSIIVGGTNNVMAANRIGSVISGGFENSVSGNVGTVAGGQGNTAGGLGAMVGGGLGNTAGGNSSYVGGGNSNTAEGSRAVVTGGNGNIAAGNASAVVGGTANTVSAGSGFVGAGKNNVVSGTFSSVIGGERNEVGGDYAVIGGGLSNIIHSTKGFIGGGEGNIDGGARAAIVAGHLNETFGSDSFIGAGQGNYTFASDSFIGSGQDNFTRGRAAFIGSGFSNEAEGDYSSVPGGIFNQASGFGSTAMGFNAKALHNGAFVYSDGSAEFASTGEDQFLIQAQGGVGIGTDSPQAALDVAGSIRASEGIQFGDGSVQTTAAFEGWNYSSNIFQVEQQSPLGFAISDQLVMRILPNQYAPNIIVGGTNNVMAANRIGSVISGGFENSVSGNVGTVAGGQGNTAGGLGAMVGGGLGNTAGGNSSYVGGGNSNTAEGSRAVVTGGNGNIAAGNASAVVGGTANTVSAGSGFVGAGKNNVVSGTFSSVIGGERNEAGGDYAVIGGGLSNIIHSTKGFIGGGEGNIDGGARAAIVAGHLNETFGSDSFIGAGQGNYTFASDSFIGSGQDNFTRGRAAFIGSGFSNEAEGDYSSVPGGIFNQASGFGSTAMGFNAKALHNGAFVYSDGSAEFASTGEDQFLIQAQGGVGIGTDSPQAALDVAGSAKVNTLRIGDSAPAGFVLTADADGNGSWQSPERGGGHWGLNGNSGVETSNYLGTVDGATLKLGVGGIPAWQLIPTPVSPNILAGHPGNSVGDSAVGVIVAGGGGETGNNSATADFSTVGGGAGNSVSGMFGTVPGGYGNTASGETSFAAGNRAQAIHSGSMLFSDGKDRDFVSAANNEFAVRATGGVRFASGSFGNSFITGVRLAPGSGSWSQLSDRDSKENLAPVDPREVLDRVAALSMTTWNYRSQDASVRHLGPMAQDFAAAFGVGENDTSISSVDADGVALAAIQGLNEVVLEKDAEIQSLKERLADLEGMVQQLIKRTDGASSLK